MDVSHVVITIGPSHEESSKGSPCGFSIGKFGEHCEVGIKRAGWRLSALRAGRQTFLYVRHKLKRLGVRYSSKRIFTSLYM